MRPIFIGGCPRSGTTLLGAMLGAAQGAVCVPEMQFKLGLLARAGSVDPRRAIAAVRADRRFELLWSIPLREPDAASSSGPELVEHVVRAYADANARGEAGVWIDHSPDNLRHAWTLARAFPEARFVHVVRDGRAVAASVMKLDWGPNDVVDSARMWTQELAFGFAAETAAGDASGVRAVRVRYEDLVHDAPSALRRLCAAVGVDYVPEMAEAGGFRPNAYTRSIHALVGSAPEPSRASAWERELSPRQVEVFESLTGDLLPALGYRRRFEAARPPTAGERRRFRVRELYGRTVANPRRRRRRVRAAGVPSAPG